MAVVRITKELRKQIIGKALSDAFDARQQFLDEEEHRLAHTCRCHVIPTSELDLVERLPKHWFYCNSFMDFNCGGPSIRLSFGEVVRLHDSDRYSSYKHPIKDEALRMRVLKHADDRSTLKKEHETAETALENLIIKCSTLKVLSEQWPEGREYYKHLEGLTPTLPAIKTEEVNKLLGLPK